MTAQDMVACSVRMSEEPSWDRGSYGRYNLLAPRGGAACTESPQIVSSIQSTLRDARKYMSSTTALGGRGLMS